MPWKVTDVMEQKIHFVTQAAVPGANISALCRESGISRPTRLTFGEGDSYHSDDLEEESCAVRRSGSMAAANNRGRWSLIWRC